jgi:GcrA cell cycle regulator
MRDPANIRRSLLTAMWRLSINGVCHARALELADAVERSEDGVRAILAQFREDGTITAQHGNFDRSTWKLNVRPEDYDHTPRYVTKVEWTDHILGRIPGLWVEGHTTAVMLERLGLPPEAKNALIGKIHRLGLPSRPSPIGVTKSDKPKYRSTRTPKPIPVLPPVTLPKLPSEAASPPVVVEPPIVPIATPPKNGPLMSAIARATTGYISPFDNVTFRPVRREPPSQPYISPAAKCTFPLWKHGARPTHKYCNAPVDRRSFCEHHADLCLVTFQPMRVLVAA